MKRAPLRLVLVPVLLSFAFVARAQDAKTEDATWKDEAEAATKGLGAEVKACQQKAIDAGREVQGTLTVAWAVTPDGKVASAVIEKSSLNDDELERCVLDAVRGLSFPPRGGGAAFVPMSQSWTLGVKKLEEEKVDQKREKGPTKEELEEQPEED